MLLNLILTMFISKLVYNYCEVGKPTVCQVRQLLLCHKMYILKLIKPLVPLALLGLNGEILLLKRKPKVHLQLMDGEVDLLKLILLLSHQTLLINEELIAVQFHLHSVYQVLDKISK